MITTRSEIIDECRVMADQLADKGINLRMLCEIIIPDMTGLTLSYLIDTGNYWKEIRVIWKAVCLKEILEVKK